MRERERERHREKPSTRDSCHHPRLSFSHSLCMDEYINGSASVKQPAATSLYHASYTVGTRDDGDKLVTGLATCVVTCVETYVVICVVKIVVTGVVP